MTDPTPEELFSYPACTHIITMPTIYNVHLERLFEGFRATWLNRQRVSLKLSIPGDFSVSRLNSLFDPQIYEFPNLIDFNLYTRYWGDVHPWEPIWQDISDYPPLPANTIYRPFRETIEFFALEEFAKVTFHGSHVVYGPVEVTPLGNRVGVILRPQSDWLIIQYPASTSQVVRKITILEKGISAHPSRQLREGKTNLKQVIDENLREGRLDLGQIAEKKIPECLVAYGKPPIDWHAAERRPFSLK